MSEQQPALQVVPLVVETVSSIEEELDVRLLERGSDRLVRRRLTLDQLDPPPAFLEPLPDMVCRSAGTRYIAARIRHEDRPRRCARGGRRVMLARPSHEGRHSGGFEPCRHL